MSILLICGGIALLIAAVAITEDAQDEQSDEHDEWAAFLRLHPELVG